MRALIALAPLALLAACQVSSDDANDQVTVQYNEDVAQEAASDAANAAGVAVNEIGEAARDVGNEVRNVDVDVDVRRDGTEANASANAN